jgi:hypothetical protein
MRTYSHAKVKHFRRSRREIHHSTRDVCNDHVPQNTASATFMYTMFPAFVGAIVGAIVSAIVGVIVSTMLDATTRRESVHHSPEGVLHLRTRAPVT